VANHWVFFVIANGLKKIQAVVARLCRVEKVATHQDIDGDARR
jgi:hypothetical protein